VGFLKLNVWRHSFARAFVNLTSKFSSIVVESSNRFYAPLVMTILYISERNLSGYIAFQHRFFKPSIDPCYISLNTPFKSNYFIKRSKKSGLAWAQFGLFLKERNLICSTLRNTTKNGCAGKL
jgi:hypothetical protein